MKINTRYLKTATLVLLVYMTISSSVYASTRVYYRGLRSGKALIDINGSLVELTPGQSFRNIVKLLSANEEVALLEISGKRYQYEIDSIRGTIMSEGVKLTLSPNGNYRANGRINGKSVTFVVDTGASYIAMNINLASALKIDRGNQKVLIHTASGTETNYLVTLDTVSIGDIKMSNIPAVISNHDHPRELLLGMSFLKHVDMSQENGQMILKYSD